MKFWTANTSEKIRRLVQLLKSRGQESYTAFISVLRTPGLHANNIANVLTFTAKPWFEVR